MTAYPLLIDNYKKTDSSTWGNATSINYGAKRQVVAYDDNYIYIMTVDAKVKFDVVQTLLLELGVNMHSTLMVEVLYEQWLMVRSQTILLKTDLLIILFGFVLKKVLKQSKHYQLNIK